MYGKLVPDELRNEIESLFPVHQMPHKESRPLVDNRSIFHCLIFVLKTGNGWRDLPTELEASEKTVRRGLKEWSESGVWKRVFELLFEQARVSGWLELAELLIDAGLVKAPCGSKKSSQTRPISVVAAVN